MFAFYCSVCTMIGSLAIGTGLSFLAKSHFEPWAVYLLWFAWCGLSGVAMSKTMVAFIYGEK